MIRLLFSTAAYLVANAIGLFIATLLLDGFRIDALSFVVAVALFSGIQAVLSPLITKITFKNFPQLMGGIALVTIFIVLRITAWIMPGMEIGGISNWLAATLLIWLGSLIASILLPIYVFKQLREKKQQGG